MSSFQEFSAKTRYDVAIVGGGLCGLLSAVILSRSGRRVALIEAKDSLGGNTAPVATSRGPLPGTLRFIAQHQRAPQLLAWFEGLLGETLVGPTLRCEPVTVESGSLVPFVGFGDRKFASVDVLTAFNPAERLEALVAPEEWIPRLAALMSEVAVTFHSEVTAFEAAEDRVAAAVINGADRLQADTFLFCAGPHLLPALMPAESLSPKVHQKIAKARLWSTLSLHLHHPRLWSESEELHFIMGSNTEFEPTVGRFFRPVTGETTQSSLWFSLWPSDLDEDAEHAGAVLKNMKKQIKRAYPELLDQVTNEKIVVHPKSLGTCDLSLKVSGNISKFENLYVISPMLSDLPPGLGGLAAAYETLGQLAGPGLARPAPEPPASNLNPESF